VAVAWLSFLDEMENCGDRFPSDDALATTRASA
jgi:hypothetical protein